MSEIDARNLYEHERTYARFVALTRWGTGLVVVVLVLMGIFLLRH